MTRARRTPLILAMSVFALLTMGISGCGTTTVKQDPSRLSGDWKAVKIRSGANTSPVDPSAEAPTAVISDGVLSGNGGVNTYRTEYLTADPDSITITVGAVTKMAGPPAAMAQENAYLSALADTRRYRVTDSTLDLLDAQGNTLVAYERAVPVTLEDNLWTCNGYNNGKQAVVSLAASSTITIRFGKDGRISGSAGVNQYTTDYKANGASMTIDPVITTTRMAGPDELMTQEKAYLEALPTTTRFEIRGDKLELRAGDALVATYGLSKP